MVVLGRLGSAKVVSGRAGVGATSWDRAAQCMVGPSRVWWDRIGHGGIG